MTEPTDKHREEARELLHACEKRTGIFLGSGSEFNDFAHHVALALSSQDAEIREVLEGLVVSVIDGENCWCPDPFSAGEELHDIHCLAARGLWKRVSS